ncbi:EAL domain-containing protein [Nonomuraea sp. NPDC002799]
MTPDDRRIIDDVPSSLLSSPMVDLDTGAVIAHPAVVDNTGTLRATPLPMMLELPIHLVLAGTGALAPLHESLRRARRHPREAILLLTGSCQDQDRPLLRVGLNSLRTIGYLIGFSDVGAAGAALDVVADASPYLLALDPDLVARIPGDHRAVAVARSVVALARGLGAHVLAPGVEREPQVAVARGLGVRLAHGPLLAPGPDGKIRVPLPLADESPTAALLGPRVQELLIPAVTLPAEATTAEEAVATFGHEPTITSVILVDEYQRPKGSLDRSRFLLSFAARYGHALHGAKPAHRLADPPRTVPRTTPVIAAMQAAGRDAARVYDDLVVTDEMNRCLGIVRVSDLIRQVSTIRT